LIFNKDLFFTNKKIPINTLERNPLKNITCKAENPAEYKPFKNMLIIPQRIPAKITNIE
jgi:hypothetical protein